MSGTIQQVVPQLLVPHGQLMGPGRRHRAGDDDDSPRPGKPFISVACSQLHVHCKKMKFWGAEVKAAKPLKVQMSEHQTLRVTQVRTPFIFLTQERGDVGWRRRIRDRDVLDVSSCPWDDRRKSHQGRIRLQVAQQIMTCVIVCFGAARQRGGGLGGVRLMLGKCLGKLLECMLDGRGAHMPRWECCK